MKKLLPLLMFTFCLCSCKSDKDVAEEIIRQYMFETLYDYDSYQPISSEPVFSSWEYVKHKFRCKTAGGLSRIHTWEFFLNLEDKRVSFYTDDKGEFQLP